MVRNGQDFELQAREVIIYKREILKYHYPELYLKAKVSAGTYIRSIAQDL
jgi:tRNA U55 pseudouridine synthase TruB